MSRQTDHRITIRLTPEEYALIVAKAETQPLATFVRGHVIEQAGGARKAHTPKPVKDHIALAQILAKLPTSPQVQNARAVADAFEIGATSADPDIIAHLTTAAADIAEIKSLLMRALGVAEQ